MLQLARGFAAAVLCSHAAITWALDVRFDAVAENVCAYIGDTGPRSVGNEGLNANLGLVVTPAGALLIESGLRHSHAHVPDAHHGHRHD